MDMTQHLRESNLIEDIDDPSFDEQAMVAWTTLLGEPELNHSVIRRTQKILTLRQRDLLPHQRGYYRDMSKVNVTIGGRAAPDWSMVKGLMDNWLLDYFELGPLDSHIRFEHIHPFVDGNGRTGRLLFWWFEVQLGKVPTLFKADERQEYYKLFKAK